MSYQEVFVKTWKNIAKFEDGEVKAWKHTKPLLQEARASARMEAYVKLVDAIPIIQEVGQE